MSEIKNLFSKKDIENMDKIFAEKTEFLKNNPEASKKFTNDKGRYDAESLDNPFQYELSKNVESFYSTKKEYSGKDDILQFALNPSNECFHSIELEKGMFLDFDKYGNPSFFRVLDATKTFETSKDALRKLKSFNLHIEINENVIEIRLRFKLLRRNDNKQIDLSPHVANDLNIPDFDNNFVLASV